MNAFIAMDIKNLGEKNNILYNIYWGEGGGNCKGVHPLVRAGVRRLCIFTRVISSCTVPLSRIFF